MSSKKTIKDYTRAELFELYYDYLGAIASLKNINSSVIDIINILENYSDYNYIFKVDDIVENLNLEITKLINVALAKRREDA